LWTERGKSNETMGLYQKKIIKRKRFDKGRQNREKRAAKRVTEESRKLSAGRRIRPGSEMERGGRGPEKEPGEGWLILEKVKSSLVCQSHGQTRKIRGGRGIEEGASGVFDTFRFATRARGKVRTRVGQSYNL